jgi:hypothetical protein
MKRRENILVKVMMRYTFVQRMRRVMNPQMMVIARWFLNWPMILSSIVNTNTDYSKLDKPRREIGRGARRGRLNGRERIMKKVFFQEICTLHKANVPGTRANGSWTL